MPTPHNSLRAIAADLRINEGDTLDGYASLDTETAFGVEFGRYANLNVFCPWCESADGSNSMSCSVNVAGMFNCKSCGQRGNAVTFFAKCRNISLSQAQAELAEATKVKAAKNPRRVRHFISHNPNNTPISVRIVDRCCHSLLRAKQHQKYLVTERGLTYATCAKYNIGCDEYRLTIPVYDEAGTLRNIRRYLPHAKNAPKMVSHQKGDGSPRLYPLSTLEDMQDGDELILCEGEWDCLLLLQHGFKAITNTGSVKVWREEWTEQIARFSVVIIFDVNDKPDHSGKADIGQRMAFERAHEFAQRGIPVKVVALPIDKPGGDITDWFVEYRKTADDLRALIDSTGWIVAPDLQESEGDESTQIEDGPARAQESQEPSQVSLHEAADAKYFYKHILCRCTVAGKGNAPYLIPKSVRAEIKMEDGTTDVLSKEFDPWDGAILSLINVSDAGQQRTLKKVLGVPPRASCSIVIESTFNVEEVHLIPDLDSGESGSYTVRRAYFVGLGIETNRSYEFSGFTLPDPSTQQVTHIFGEARATETSIDRFSINSEQTDKLQALFSTDDPHTKLEDIADQLSEHVTHIYGRPDLHIALDLAFHSPLSFYFDGNLVRKGWLECLVIGDTRTGKGFVAEGLMRYYRVGEIVSGESVTLPGLVGTVMKLGERWALVWGKIPLNDRRLVVIDECSSLQPTDIAKLSRIRSEGVAEITKAITDKTNSRTRLIWLGNPRPRGEMIQRSMQDFNYGVEAVPELIGMPEDVARFDYVVVVSQNEVKSEDINKRHVVSSTLAYDQELCQTLLQWVWSRTPDQIVFDPEAEERIFQAALSLGRTFSPKVNLIQTEDVRFKLARIAAATAARLFSTTDGETLLVLDKHVEFAFNFLYHLYAKPSCGYLQLSMIEKERASLKDMNILIEAMQEAGDCLPDLIDGLLEHKVVSKRDIVDLTLMDEFQAQSLISTLVRCRALIKTTAGYTKKPAFKALLRKLKHSTLSGESITQLDLDEESVFEPTSDNTIQSGDDNAAGNP